MIYKTSSSYYFTIISDPGAWRYDSMVGITPNTAFDGIHNITFNPFNRTLRADGRRGEAGRHRGTPGVRDDGRGGGRTTKRYADGRQKCKR